MRPAVHLTAPINWMNDPNGLVRWDGIWHVFFQHHPDAPRWGRIQWGHASSADLAHWTRHPAALVPADAPEAPDRDGCWSGCVAVVDGVPTAFYTGVTAQDGAHRQSVCRATSDGDLTIWRKDPTNPILSGEPRAGRRHQRDPFLLRLGGRWLMLLGSGLTGENGESASGAVVALESDDARTWYDRGVLFGRPAGVGAIDTGPMWECPQLFQAGERWILIVSIQLRDGPDAITHGAVWFAGDLIDDGPGLGAHFVPATMGWLDGGDILYAPAVLPEPDGRILAWGWLQDPDPDLSGDDGPVVVGALSLPRVLDFDGQRLVTWPAPELDGLAVGEPTWPAQVDLGPGDRCPIELPSGGAGAWRIAVSLDPTGLAGIVLARSPDGRTAFAVGLERTADGATALVAIDVLDDAATSRLPTLLPPTDDSVRLDVFVDGTIVEAFAGGAALATRIDRRALPVDRVELVAPRGAAHFTELVATALGSAVTIAEG
jgi:beta-fructofuranosidase